MRAFSGSLARYGASVAFVGATTALVALVRAAADVHTASMLYLLAVMASAVVAGSRAAALTAVASFLAYNFFFLEPHYTFNVSDDDQWIALALFLVTGIITGQLAGALRDRARDAERREKEAVVLYDVVRLMSEPELGRSLAGIAERLASELRLAAIVVDVGGVRRSAGEPDAVSAAEESIDRPEVILAGGKPPTAGAAARPGRWVKIVRPGQRSPGDGRYQLRSVPVSLGDTRAGWIVLVRPRSEPLPGGSDDRLLSAVAHQLKLALERLRLQQEATEAEVLRRTDEQRTALLNAVSHDLRTPLASIIASAGSLMQEDVEWTDEQRRELTALIEQEAERLNRLVGNLLDLSRIEAGSIRPQMGWYDLGSLVAEAAGRVSRMSDDRPISVDVPDDMPPVRFDYVEIEQVLTNLLENAVRHTRPGTEVGVSVRAAGELARVEVRDKGRGVPENVLPDLFKAFYRATEAGAGSGLGLAVAKGLVEAHGGTIWAENAPGGGACFTFTLPLTESPAAVA